MNCHKNYIFSSYISDVYELSLTSCLQIKPTVYDTQRNQSQYTGSRRRGKPA